MQGVNGKMDVNKVSVVKQNYNEKDPRKLAYLYPSINIVVYAKKVQEFCFYQSLDVAEDLANRQGYLLLPYSCMHWTRAKNYADDRKVKIGRKSFFMMKPHELTKNEINKLYDYIWEVVGHEPSFSKQS